MRVTDKMLQNQSNRLNKLMGTPLTPYQAVKEDYVANVGNIHIDSNITGLQLCRMDNDGGGTSTPYGSERMTKKQALSKLETIIKAIEAYKGQ